MIVLQIANSNPQDFFTMGSFATLAGATGIVYIVCGAIQQAFNFSPKWLALVVSMIISCIAAYVGIITLQSMNPEDLSKAQQLMLNKKAFIYLLALLNGCLIYMTATGANQLIAKNPPQPNPPILPGPHNANKPVKRKFASNWWHG